MNYTIAQFAYENMTQGERITDLSYITRYCTAYYNQLPLIFAILSFVSITALALFGYKLSTDWNDRLWIAAISAIWVESMIIMFYFFPLLP